MIPFERLARIPRVRRVVGTAAVLLAILGLALTGCDTTAQPETGPLTAPGLLVGERVGLGAEVAVLGAPGSNEAFVFVRTASGWSGPNALRPSGSRVADPFYGQHLALDGGTLVVGSPEAEVGTDATGSAYAYERSGGRWVETAELRPDDLAPGAGFGGAVAVSDGVIAVASADGRGGRVHLFEKTGGTWSRTTVLEHPETGSAFGLGVALDGGRLAVVGLTGEIGTAGRAYVFERSGGATWALTGTASAPPLPSSTPLGFGLDVALDGPTLVVNEPGRGAGTVYVFREGAAGWSTETVLTRPRTEIGPLALFGFRLALDGDHLLVAVPGREIGGESIGAAILYTRGAGGDWAEEAELRSRTSTVGFARDVALSGETALVGANDGERDGRGLLFARGPGGWSPLP